MRRKIGLGASLFANHYVCANVGFANNAYQASGTSS